MFPFSGPSDYHKVSISSDPAFGLGSGFRFKVQGSIKVEGVMYEI